MSLYVQKYGGTSVATTQHIANVARRIERTRAEGHDVVVVVSAMGKETDRLMGLFGEVNVPTSPDVRREMDVLLSTGEQVTISLLAMTLMKIGIPSQSFLGNQVQILTDGQHTKARIEAIDTSAIQEGLAAGKVIVGLF